VADPEQKLHALCTQLGRHDHESALIFCNLKATVRELTEELSRGGVSVDCLHGDMEQYQRDHVMAKFRNGSVRLLVATDVAARGIDVSDLDVVVNYDLPSQPEVYVHRIGRTGRAGKEGLSITLATSREQDKLVAIEQLTRSRMERVSHKSGALPGLPPLSKALLRAPKMSTLLISGGRNHKIRPGDILGALTGEAGGFGGDDIGKIEIHDRRTYVAVSREIAGPAVKSLNDGRIKAKRFKVEIV
jgi:ATP-independent RNA helicase DbpA